MEEQEHEFVSTVFRDILFRCVHAVENGANFENVVQPVVLAAKESKTHTRPVPNACASVGWSARMRWTGHSCLLSVVPAYTDR